VTRRKPNEPDDTSDDEAEKKERVIHTRVPESLENQLRVRAEELGVSVSNLVRNVLNRTFGLVDGVVADSHAVAKAARGTVKRAPPPAPSLDDVLGWQPLVLGKNAVCSRCNALLPKGSDAATGVSEAGDTRFVICTDCVDQLRA
jgi:plasmid stability protein